MTCKLLVVALVPRARIESGAPALGAQSLSHWITRKVPICIFKYTQSLPFMHVLPVKEHILETLVNIKEIYQLVYTNW